MSDDDWEDAPIPAPVANNNKFKNEVTAVVFDEPKTATSSAPVAKTNKVQQLKQQEEELTASRPLTAEEKRAEAARIRKAVEDSEQELSEALFGNAPKPKTSVNATPAPSKPAAKKAAASVQDVKGLTEFFSEVPLTNTNQAKNAAVALGKNVAKAKKDVHLMFVRELLKECCEALTDNDVNELTGVLSVIKNEKVKAKFAKKTTAKPALNSKGLDKMGGERDDHDDYYDDYYDEGDFM